MSDDETPERMQKQIDYRIDLAMLEKRRIYLSDAVDDASSRDIIRKLWYLDHVAPGKPILFVINSPGGSVDAGFAIWDQIKMISSPVVTLATGLAASIASVLSLCPGKGRRLATPNARILIHQPHIMGLIRGQATDLEIQAREILKTRQMIVDVYAHATGKDPKVIDKAIDRDNWMTVEEALAYGLLDKIVTSMKEVEALLK